MNQFKSAFTALIIVGLFSAQPASAAKTKQPTLKQLRIKQAQELLGKHYKKSAVRYGEKVSNIRPMIEDWAEQSMPKKERRKSKLLAKAVIEASKKHGFDPIFLMSIIETESSFDPKRIGGVGEIGLMQIRPETAEWISKKFKMKWTGKASLFNPATNVAIGAQFVAYLRDRFDSQARLYLSAYNMGARKVDEHVENKYWPKEYSNRVMSHYVSYYDQVKDRVQPSRTIASAE